MGEAIHRRICSITLESRVFHQLAEFYAGWGADYQQIVPGAYHRAIRYNLARRELLEAKAGTPVTDTATRWGFYHFGRVSTGCRCQFGESLSQTLARSIGLKPLLLDAQN